MPSKKKSGGNKPQPKEAPTAEPVSVQPPTAGPSVSVPVPAAAPVAGPAPAPASSSTDDIDAETSLAITRRDLIAQLRAMEEREGPDVPRPTTEALDQLRSGRQHLANQSGTRIRKPMGAEAQLGVAFTEIDKLSELVIDARTQATYWKSRWQRTSRISQLLDQSVEHVQRQARELSSAYDASTAALRSQLAMEQARSDGLAAKQQEIVTLIDTQCADMLAKQQALGSENDTLRTQLKSLLGNYDKMQALLTQADGALTGERARTAAAVQALAAERAAREEQTTEFSAQLKTLTGEYKGYVSAMEEHRDALRASDARAVQSAGREKEWAARVTALTAHLKEQRDANAALTKDVGRLKELNATLLARIKQQQQQRSVVLAEPEVITVEEAKPAAATLDAAAV